MAPIISTFGSGSARGFGRAQFVFKGFAFTTATFTPGGAIGRSGPSLTQARNGLTGPEVNDWSTNTSFFNTSNGVQLWTVPKTANYKITCRGAKGGDGDGGANQGGSGARVTGEFELQEGSVLNIVVGQQGRFINATGSDGQNSGGGGGTFVWSSNSPLIIAGGGGGASSGESFFSSMNGQAGESAGVGRKPGGGTGISGGSGGNRPNIAAPFGDHRAGVGAGWLTGSVRNAHNQCDYIVEDGAGPLNSNALGGRGGGGDDPNTQKEQREGGFGGGGGASGACNTQGSGGGGGYNGGGVGAECCTSQGGGGGSFNSGSNPSATEGENAGDGSVIIELLG